MTEHPQESSPPAHVTPLQFWSAIIPLLASSIIIPMWQMWLSSQHEANRQQDAQKVIANQDKTHAEITAVKVEQDKVAEKAEETANKVDLIHAKTDAITSLLPDKQDKPPVHQD